MKKIILLLFLVGCLIFVLTAPRGEFGRIDRILKMTFRSARNYPPQFSSQKHKQYIEIKLIDVIGQLESMLAQQGERTEILFRLGKANTFGYNMDFPNSRQKADRCFAKLFALNPNHAEGHLYYGQHLSGRGDFDAGIKHLQIAADAGQDIALNMLGLAYLQKGNHQEAKKYFKKMQEKQPNNPQLKILLDSIENPDSSEYQIMHNK